MMTAASPMLFVVGFLLHILPQVTGIINHCMRSISVFFCDLCLLYDFTYVAIERIKYINKINSVVCCTDVKVSSRECAMFSLQATKSSQRHLAHGIQQLCLFLSSFFV